MTDFDPLVGMLSSNGHVSRKTGFEFDDADGCAWTRTTEGVPFLCLCDQRPGVMLAARMPDGTTTLARVVKEAVPKTIGRMAANDMGFHGFLGRYSTDGKAECVERPKFDGDVVRDVNGVLFSIGVARVAFGDVSAMRVP
jgi:hypothetical protein